MAIKFLIDSSSDISMAEAKKMGVEMLPIEVRFEEEEYLDGETLLPKEFYEKLIESAELPKTSQINEYRYDEKLKTMVGENDEVIIITLSSKLSGTYTQAKNAAKNYKNVYVVDSLNASAGERLIIEYALKLKDAGKSASEIVSELEIIKHNIVFLAVLGTLKYLRKGGRINPAVAFAGEMLSIKPVISVTKGEVKLEGKAVGSKKGNNLLMQFIEKSGGIDFDMPYSTIYSGLSDDLLNKYLKDSEHIWKDSTDNVPKHILGSTIGTHIGPGAIGVAFFANKK